MPTNQQHAAEIIGKVMSRWDMDGRPDVSGGIDTCLAQALADADCLKPDGMEDEWAVSVGWATLDGKPIEQRTGWGSSEEEALKDARQQKVYYLTDSREEGFISSRRQVTMWEPVSQVEHDTGQA